MSRSKEVQRQSLIAMVLFVSLSTLFALAGCALVGLGPKATVTPTPSPVRTVEPRAPAATPTPTPPTVGRMVLKSLGERVYLDGLDITPKALSRTREPAVTEGQEVAKLQIEVENATTTERALALFSFALVDDKDNRYPPIVNEESKVLSGKIPSEKKIQGTLTFEIPTQSKGLKLIYQTGKGWSWWLLEP